MAIYKNNSESHAIYEADLMEEEALNEAITFKFIKNDQVPEDFKKFAASMVDIMESNMTKKLGSGTAGLYGLRFGKVKEKIEKKNPKNCYIINVPYKGIIQALGQKPSAKDSILLQPAVVSRYFKQIMSKSGLKEYKGGDIYYKTKNGCMYVVNWAITDSCFLYIRCLEDSERNLAVMAGDDRFVESTLFKNVKFLNESSCGLDIVGESTITNFSCFAEGELNEEALLEGAKFNAKMKNWLQEGEDYKNLKSDVKKVIAANNLDDEKLKSGKSGFMHICKRIIQVLLDIGPIFSGFGIGSAVGTGIALSAATGTPVGLIVAAPYIIGFIVGFICNRLLRFAVDSAEFSTIQKDAFEIKDQLEKKARETKDPKMKAKLESEAKKLDDAIKKYSK